MVLSLFFLLCGVQAVSVLLFMSHNYYSYVFDGKFDMNRKLLMDVENKKSELTNSKREGVTLSIDICSISLDTEVADIQPFCGINPIDHTILTGGSNRGAGLKFTTMGNGNVKVLLVELNLQVLPSDLLSNFNLVACDATSEMSSDENNINTSACMSEGDGYHLVNVVLLGNPDYSRDTVVLEVLTRLRNIFPNVPIVVFDANGVEFKSESCDKFVFSNGTHVGDSIDNCLYISNKYYLRDVTYLDLDIKQNEFNKNTISLNDISYWCDSMLDISNSIRIKNTNSVQLLDEKCRNYLKAVEYDGVNLLGLNHFHNQHRFDLKPTAKKSFWRLLFLGGFQNILLDTDVCSGNTSDCLQTVVVLMETDCVKRLIDPFERVELFSNISHCDQSVLMGTTIIGSNIKNIIAKIADNWYWRSDRVGKYVMSLDIDLIDNEKHYILITTKSLSNQLDRTVPTFQGYKSIRYCPNRTNCHTPFTHDLDQIEVVRILTQTYQAHKHTQIELTVSSDYKLIQDQKRESIIFCSTVCGLLILSGIIVGLLGKNKP